MEVREHYGICLQVIPAIGEGAGVFIHNSPFASGQKLLLVAFARHCQLLPCMAERAPHDRGLQMLTDFLISDIQVLSVIDC